MITGSDEVWKTADLLNGKDRSRPNDTFDDIQEWLNQIVIKPGNIDDTNSLQELNPYESSNDNTTGIGGSDDSLVSPIISSAKKNFKINKKKIKKIVNKKENSKHSNGKHKKFDVKLEDSEVESLPDDYGPQIECNFNLPRVSAQLEKLMGTNVVRLTDRKYMQELRERIQDDFNATLQKRIDQREAIEMERERNLIMGGKSDIVPKELADHPVFIVNKQTNTLITKTRSKLKTNREKAAERLIKQGAKWEKDRLIYDELDRKKEIELQKKREASLLMEEEYTESNKERGMDLLRIKNRDYTECEMGLKNFCDEEREIMTKRLQPPKIKLDPNSKDIQIIDALKKEQRDERRRKNDPVTTNVNSSFEISEKSLEETTFEAENLEVHSPSTVKLELSKSSKHSKKSKVETTTNIDNSQPNDVVIRSDTFDNEYNDSPKLKRRIEIELLSDDEDLDELLSVIDDTNSDVQILTDEEHFALLQQSIQDEIEQGHMLEEKDYENLHYEDPMILILKETNNVTDLYNLANEIIGGVATAPPLQGRKK